MLNQRSHQCAVYSSHLDLRIKGLFFSPRREYDKAFTSRPKIPRTPDSRPRTSTPPPLGRSTSPTRPTSKDERLGEYGFQHSQRPGQSLETRHRNHRCEWCWPNSSRKTSGLYTKSCKPFTSPIFAVNFFIQSHQTALGSLRQLSLLLLLS